GAGGARPGADRGRRSEDRGMNPAAARISARIGAVTATPVAFADPPLLNSVGVHEPLALRSLVRLGPDARLVGGGEAYARDRRPRPPRAGARGGRRAAGPRRVRAPPPAAGGRGRPRRGCGRR